LKLTAEQKRDLERLIASGNTIEAIKQYRNIADVGLAEAKAFIDSLAGGASPLAAMARSAGIDAKKLQQAEAMALAALRKGNAMDAIKHYRHHTKVGLKQAKEAVDALSVVQRTEGRINAKLAASVLAMVRAGQKEQAVTQIMSNAGFDENEANALIRTMGSTGLGGASCGGGCLKALVALALLGALAWTLFKQAGLL
jgi:ribosomal protein L7/L12